MSQEGLDRMQGVWFVPCMDVQVTGDYTCVPETFAVEA